MKVYTVLALFVAVDGSVFGDVLDLLYNRMVGGMENLSTLYDDIQDVNDNGGLWSESGPCTPEEPKVAATLKCPKQFLGDKFYYSNQIALVSSCTSNMNPFQGSSPLGSMMDEGFRFGAPPSMTSFGGFRKSYTSARESASEEELASCCVEHKLCYSNCSLTTGTSRAYQKEFCDMKRFQCETSKCGVDATCMLRVIEQCRSFKNQIELMECTQQQSVSCGGTHSCRASAFSSLFFSSQLGCDDFNSAQLAACASCPAGAPVASGQLEIVDTIEQIQIREIRV